MKKFFLLIISIFAFGAASAQVTTSSMSGTVIDEQGQPLVGTTVIAVHTPSGTQYGVAADNKGNYRIYNARVGGPYTVTFSMIGYQSVDRTGIELSLGENYVLNAKLNEDAIGMDAVVIAIDGKGSSMNSDRAGAVTTVDRKTMALTPTISRSMNDIMRLSPQSSTLPGNGFAVGGGTFRQSYVTVDGAAFNNAFGIGQNLPAGGSPISLDALEQISVAVTPYDVRQSGFTGGAINAVTRSGDNEFRGTLYTYLTNNNLRGKNVDGTELPNVEDAKQYTYGASIGGPIIKDKLFFFVNGEYEDNVSAGPSKVARANETSAWGDKTNINRPTVGDMDQMSNFLKSTYGYDPGIYQGYSAKTPSYRVMARMDWNVNKNNKINVRFSKTNTKGSSNPSSSTNPLTGNRIFPGGTTADGNVIGAGQNISSNYGLFYKNSRYYEEQNFTSVAGEWNSSWLNGRLNNTMRFSFSRQDDPRSYDGDKFPFVTILKDGAPYMSFGTEFFTENNLRQVSTYVATNELNYVAGINNLTLGLQYEHNDAANGYMQGANGYYIFKSMSDFMTNQKPSAFCMTHSNSPDASIFTARMQYSQFSAYLQDEISINKNLKVTAGIRFELPHYPSLKNNYNAAYADLKFGDNQYSTDQLPKNRVTVSPRVGFNWDITGDRKYVLRGGSGYFVGRLPFVWLVSAVGNSGVGQTQYFFNDQASATGGIPNFHPNQSDIIADIYPNGFSPTPVAPKEPTIIDKDLKMPATWKTSLAMDIKLPANFDLTVEGIYNRDYNPAVVANQNIYDKGETVTISPNDTRTKYAMYNPNNNAYLITNAGTGAYYYSISAQIRKRFSWGLDVMAAYTHSHSRAYNDGLGSQVTSAYKTNTFSRNGVNERELGYGTYVAPDRIILSLNYRKVYGKHFATNVGLLYEGSQMAAAGGYFYSRYSYTLSSNVVGDGGGNNLLYIPESRAELDKWQFAGNDKYTANEMRDDFWSFVEQDAYLSKNKGSYAERGGAIMPWHHQVDLKFSQEFFITTKNGKRNTIEVGVDIQNLPNLLSNKWGNYKMVNTTSPLKYSNGKGFETNTVDGKRLSQIDSFTTYNNLYSTYRVMFSVRYKFN